MYAIYDQLIMYETMEGEHQLWHDILGSYKEAIRAFLDHF